MVIMNTEVQLLQQIADDIVDIKGRMTKLEVTMEEIDMDLHEVKPTYVEKLKRIEKEGSISQREFEKRFGVKI